MVLSDTKPEVFIIESLDPDDEGNGRFEGSILSRILKLHEKSPKYRYVRTKKEFMEAISQFHESKYRYLHISAHANAKCMYTTNQDEINFDKLAKILNPHLNGRRLFLSACSMVQEDLAKKIFLTSDCLSVIGSKNDIYFTDAAILWSTFYHLMFTSNSKKMENRVLKDSLQKISTMFGVSISFFSKSKTSKHDYREHMYPNDLE